MTIKGMLECSYLDAGSSAEDNYENVMPKYQGYEYGGDVELNILCHLCPGLRVQIVQGVTDEDHSHLGSVNTTPFHTIFIKRTNPQSKTSCHYNIMFWEGI